MNKKNIVITIIIIISLLACGYLGFIIGTNHSNQEFNDNKDNNTPKNNSDIKEEQKDIVKQIDLIKNDNTISDLEKATKITFTIYQNTFNILKFNSSIICEESDNTYICNFKDNDNVGYYTNISNDFNRILEGDVWFNLTNDNDSQGISLDKLINSLNFNAYSRYLKKKLNISESEGMYGYMENKFSLTKENICIGYSEDEKYFYININKVSNPKQGWYYFDKWTGKCTNTIDTVAKYKINKTNYEYEEIINNK